MPTKAEVWPLTEVVVLHFTIIDCAATTQELILAQCKVF